MDLFAELVFLKISHGRGYLILFIYFLEFHQFIDVAIWINKY